MPISIECNKFKKNLIMPDIHRFIRLCYLLFTIMIAFASCTKETVVSRQWMFFDTVVAVKFYGDLPDTIAEKLWTLAEKEFSLWDSLTNPYDSLSAVYRLNTAQAETLHADKRLMQLLSDAFEWRRKTDCAFEPLIGHITNLWGISRGKERVPTGAEIDSALNLCRKSGLRAIDDSTLVSSGNIEIDPGAFAKGFAIDRVYEILLPQCKEIPSIKGFLIDAGRNIRGWNRSGKPFKIGIAHPRGQGIIAAFKLPSEFACASAGDYERYFICDGIRYHHIFDPKTGYPSKGAIAATVIAPTAFIADVASTAAMVMDDDIEKILDTCTSTVILFDEKDKNVSNRLLGKRIRIDF